MTFSGSFDPKVVKTFVKEQLKITGFYVNDKKTVVARNGQQKNVTGIVVNERPNTTAAYRKKLRQELYYCKTYGVYSHMQRTQVNVTEDTYLRQLLGQVNYVLSVDPLNEEMQGYKRWIKKQI